MNLLMMTNTYLPHVGGVARSVHSFAQAHRRAGHRVLVVAPTFDGADPAEVGVVRVPALQHFNGSDFSVPLPLPGFLHGVLEEFQPDIVHSHHPFLLGDTALRIAAVRDIPIVFTFHTRYDKYTHYVPGDSEILKRFIVDLATGYANLCDAVIAPSASMAVELAKQGVRQRIEAIPTGIDVAQFRSGDGRAMRSKLGVPSQARVVGHVGRLAPEKNLPWLARAVVTHLQRDPEAWFLIAGSGPCEEEIREILTRGGVESRLRMLGTLTDGDLAGAYAAMDVFAFASLSETQGMVLAEAAAAGVPVVALDAPGAREVVRDGLNGRLLQGDDAGAFDDALGEVLGWKCLPPDRLARELDSTAQDFSLDRCTRRAFSLYQSLLAAGRTKRDPEEDLWETAVRRLREEWAIFSITAGAVGGALEEGLTPGPSS